MSAAKLPETVVLCCALGALSCSSDHNVSPWGGVEHLPMELYVQRPDLRAQLERVAAETTAHGLRKTSETEDHFDKAHGGAAFRVLGFEGRDAFGRALHATRVVTPVGVPLALGPLDASDMLRGRATELVVALALAGDGPGGAFRSGTDLNGDGLPDVVLKNDAGVLEIWRVDPHGASAYEIVLAAPATAAIDVDRDGKVDLFGQIDVPPKDPIAPVLADVATFFRGRYDDGSPAAIAWHEAKAALLTPRAATPAPASPTPPAPLSEGPTDEERLRAAVERAWHEAFARRPIGPILARLRDEPAPLRLSFAVERWRRRIEKSAPSVRSGP